MFLDHDSGADMPTVIFSMRALLHSTAQVKCKVSTCLNAVSISQVVQEIIF